MAVLHLFGGGVRRVPITEHPAPAHIRGRGDSGHGEDLMWTFFLSLDQDLDADELHYRFWQA